MIDKKKAQQVQELINHAQEYVNPRYRLISVRDLVELLEAARTTRAAAVNQVIADLRRTTPSNDEATQAKITALENKYKIIL